MGRPCDYLYAALSVSWSICLYFIFLRSQGRRIREFPHPILPRKCFFHRGRHASNIACKAMSISEICCGRRLSILHNCEYFRSWHGRENPDSQRGCPLYHMWNGSNQKLNPGLPRWDILNCTTPTTLFPPFPRRVPNTQESGTCLARLSYVSCVI
jgi:hypothetical protein